jgi:hypothetical protein
LLAESEVLKQKSLLRDEERPNRGPDDGEQERHLPKLAEAENVHDINADGVSANYAQESIQLGGFAAAKGGQSRAGEPLP